MTDYIRKAVELADGFQLTSDENHFSLPHGGYLPAVEVCPQQYLDALAAQLVRQVDALETNDTVETTAKRVWVGSKSHHHETWKATSANADRTMNTIRAIVDSGVLE